MGVSASARHDKIKPFFGHGRKNKYTQIRRRNIRIFIDYSIPAVPRCPTLSLFLEIRAVEAEIKIFMIFRRPYFRKPDYFPASMINNSAFYNSALLAHFYLDYNKSRRYMVKIVFGVTSFFCTFSYTHNIILYTPFTHLRHIQDTKIKRL